VPGIPTELMHPEKEWSSRVEYQEALSTLAVEFIENYNKKYKGKLGEFAAAVDAAVPVI